MPEILMVARCHPTEDRGRVLAAMTRLFPDAVADGEDPIVARAASLDHFAEQLARQRIRAAARKVLLKGMGERDTRFRLNKQVASLGKVSFSEEEHALGDIEVTISADRIMDVVDAIAPRPPAEGEE